MEQATRDEEQSGGESKRTKEYERNEPNTTRRLQRLHQERMQMRTMAPNPRELEEKTLEGENSM